MESSPYNKIVWVVKSGRTPLAFEAPLLLALPLLLTLAKFAEETTYKDYPLIIIFLYFLKTYCQFVEVILSY